MTPTKLPTVCIVGRPNVGKSTLFNRIIRSRRAVIHETSGTTRDRVEAAYKDSATGSGFRLVDTGGFLKATPDRMSSLVKKQIQHAISGADILLFVCDIRAGVTPQDEELLPIIRKSSKKTFLAVNKADNRSFEENLYDFYRLGLGNPYPISAAHNRGINTLIEDILKSLESAKKGETEKVVYKIAIAGRPNVGKSFFLNTLLNEERVIVHNAPGTTRDSIDTYFRREGSLFLLIDTAGIRHKRKIKEAIDVYSIMRSKEAIKRSDTTFLLIDGYDGLRNDDVRIFDFIVKSGKCCVIVVNKWDLAKRIEMADYKNAMIRKTPPLQNYPIIFASAKTGRNVLAAADMVKYVMANTDTKIETRRLNDFLLKMKRVSRKLTKRIPKLCYMVQTETRPPAFLIFVNDTKLVTKEFSSFFERSIRRDFMLLGSPLRLAYRRKK